MPNNSNTITERIIQTFLKNKYGEKVDKEILREMKLYHMVFDVLKTLPPMTDEELYEALMKLQSFVFEESEGGYY